MAKKKKETTPEAPKAAPATKGPKAKAQFGKVAKELTDEMSKSTDPVVRSIGKQMAFYAGKL